MNFYRNLAIPSQGDRCEFRHSEAAFNNSRPCTYWMQGTCTRRDCTYMHVVSVNSARLFVRFVSSFHMRSGRKGKETKLASVSLWSLAHFCCVDLKSRTQGVPGMAAMGNMFFGGMPNPLFGMDLMGGMMPGQTPLEGASDSTDKSKAKQRNDSISNGTEKDQRVKPVAKNDKGAESEHGGKENASIVTGKRKLSEQAIETNKPSSAKVVKVVQQPQTPAQDQPTEVANMPTQGDSEC